MLQPALRPAPHPNLVDGTLRAAVQPHYGCAVPQVEQPASILVDPQVAVLA